MRATTRAGTSSSRAPGARLKQNRPLVRRSKKLSGRSVVLSVWQEKGGPPGSLVVKAYDPATSKSHTESGQLPAVSSEVKAAEQKAADVRDACLEWLDTQCDEPGFLARVAAATSNAAEGKEAAATAEEHAQAGRWPEALRSYRTAAARSPTDPKILLGVGRSQLRMGSTTEAVDTLKMVVILARASATSAARGALVVVADAYSAIGDAYACMRPEPKLTLATNAYMLAAQEMKAAGGDAAAIKCRLQETMAAAAKVRQAAAEKVMGTHVRSIVSEGDCADGRTHDVDVTGEPRG